MTILGVDLSLNHSGFVQLNAATGVMEWWYAVSDTKSHSANRDNVAFMPYKKAGNDREQINLRRLAWWNGELPRIMGWVQPTHVGIEDYAIRAESVAAYQIGEVGGVARLAALAVGAKIRLHDPLTVKMFTAHMGNAQPITVAIAVRERWPETEVWASLPEIVMVDLCCAYALARMTYVETKLRSGELQLKDLEHEKEIAVFQRATKANPVSLLGREWLGLE
jgi:Holliday junction resolvasome RuvABC endonuclease subunit